QQVSDTSFQPSPFANHAHANIAFVEFNQIIAYEAAKKTHELADFARRSRPVFRAKRKNRDDLDADFSCRANCPSQRFDTASVPFSARQAACCRPAAIATHYDGDMTRHIECRRRALLDFGFGHATRPQTVRISFSFAASM